MRKISEIVTEQLCLLAVNPELKASVDAVSWKPGNRLRIILELDIEDTGVRMHGYEFRYRNPSMKMLPNSQWVRA